MKTILIWVVALFLLTGGILIYRDYYVKRRFRKLALQKYKVVEPLMGKLASRGTISPDEVLRLAKDPAFRHAIYRTLEGYGQKDLFPIEYLTQEKGAESFLVNWLEFPTELGAAPEEIELLKKVLLDNGLTYFVFKYRASTPDWAARSSWMMGVAGPYHDESMPFDVPLRVYSRFNTVDSVSPEVEACWVHDNISQ